MLQSSCQVYAKCMPSVCQVDAKCKIASAKWDMIRHISPDRSEAEKKKFSIAITCQIDHITRMCHLALRVVVATFSRIQLPALHNHVVHQNARNVAMFTLHTQRTMQPASRTDLVSKCSCDANSAIEELRAACELYRSSAY